MYSWAYSRNTMVIWTHSATVCSVWGSQ